jgi:hypothetical protein
MVFSNVLTTVRFAHKALPVITELMRSQSAGSVAYFTGGVGTEGAPDKDYGAIFALVDAAAEAAAWSKVKLDPEMRSSYEDEAAAFIADCQRRIWQMIRQADSDAAAVIEAKPPKNLRHVVGPPTVGPGYGRFSVRVYDNRRFRP